MRVSVLQPGARLHYALPAALAGAGVLERFYTDLHAEHWWLQAPHAASIARMMPKPVRRMLARRLPADLQGRLVHDRALETIARHAAALAGFRSHGPERVELGLLSDIERSGIGPGDILYTLVPDQDTDTVARLRDRGVTIVHEAFVSPLWEEILERERERFPGVEPPQDSREIRSRLDRARRKYASVDAIVAPSRFVADGVRALGAQPDIVHLVPYGLDGGPIVPAAAHPVPGRVLFVGTVGLRKGGHHFAAAARALAGSGTEFVAVGPAPPRIVAHPLMRGPTYRGQVPRNELAGELRAADVFVLPTLCEGMALAHLEALAAGVPVVTTPNCGSVVRDGIEGFVIEPHDRENLAHRILQICGDRELRAWMSRNARERAAEYSLPRYRERLLSMLADVAGRSAFRAPKATHLTDPHVRDSCAGAEGVPTTRAAPKGSEIARSGASSS